MPITFSQRPSSPTDGPHALGDVWAYYGILSFSGRYATGGEVLTLPTLSPGVGDVQAVFFTSPAGYILNYEPDTSRVLLYSAARTEFSDNTEYPTEFRNPIYALFLYQ